MAFWLEFEQDGAKQQYPFDGASISVGRDTGSDFVLDHPTVSRQHAVIVQNPNGFRLVVLSRGGMTAVDGNQIQGEVDVYDGSVLHFGQLTFTFRSNEASPKPSGAGAGAGFGASPAAGFGNTPSGGGFGNAPAAGGFGNTPTGGFGTPPAAGFGSGSPAGFGQNGSSGFGGQPSGFGANAGGQASGFGQPPAGGFGQTPGQPAAEPGPPQPTGEGGIMSWDDIADSAEAKSDSPHEQADTNFKRIQEAAKRADEQSKSNPVLMIGAGLLIVGMIVFIMMPEDEGGGPVKVVQPDEMPPITWQAKDLDCVGKAECMAKARLSYKVGVETLDKVEVDIANRFEGYRRLMLADEFSKKAGNETIPDEFPELEERRKKARAELDAIFQQSRVKYHNLSKYKMYPDMVSVLNEVVAVFPYKGAREYQWALDRERKLKEDGNYPQKFN